MRAAERLSSPSGRHVPGTALTRDLAGKRDRLSPLKKDENCECEPVGSGSDSVVGYSKLHAIYQSNHLCSRVARRRIVVGNMPLLLHLYEHICCICMNISANCTISGGKFRVAT